MRDRIESLILYSLISNEEYTRKVLPFLKEEYFSEKHERTIFCTINSFILKYNNLPTKEAIIISLNNDPKIKEDEYKELCGYISDDIADKIEKVPDPQWLLDKTEEWCKDKAIYNAVMNTIKIIDDKDSKQEKGVIPKLLSDALAVGFSTNIGHDYFENIDEQFEYYHKKEKKLEFDLELFNKITRGGIKTKTLTVILAGTNVGKSLCLSHFAAGFLSGGKNVLYITLEMSEPQIRARIDSNLLNIKMEDLENIPETNYKEKLNRLRSKTQGHLIIQEYPEVSAHVGHFRHLLNELNLKKNFKPDVIIVDYLNLALSNRIKPGTIANSYTYILSVAQEIRGLAKEFDVPCISATQTNRHGQNNTDLDFEDVSESHGLSATCDYIFGMTTTEELDKLDQVMFKQIKNRHGDKTKFKRFVVGINRDHMRLYDVEQSAQKNIADSGQEKDDTPAFDKSKFGDRMKKSKDFSKIKVDDMF